MRSVLAVVLVFTTSFAVVTFGQRCGKERWAVKTGTDSGIGRQPELEPEADYPPDAHIEVHGKKIGLRHSHLCLCRPEVNIP